MKLSKEEYDQAVNHLKRYNRNLANNEKKELNIVNSALLVVNDDTKKIFEMLYKEKINRWDIMDELHISESTFKRRKQELINAVHDEIQRTKNIAL